MATILIVDDDVEVLKLMRKELEAEGFRVIQASNGQTAIRIAEQQQPDLIVLDVAMPVSNGLTAFNAMRNMPKTQRIPVIFMTSLPSANVYPTVEAGSRVAHLKKPVDVVDLVSMVRQFLEKYPTQ